MDTFQKNLQDIANRECDCYYSWLKFWNMLDVLIVFSNIMEQFVFPPVILEFRPAFHVFKKLQIIYERKSWLTELWNLVCSHVGYIGKVNTWKCFHDFQMIQLLPFSKKETVILEIQEQLDELQEKKRSIEGNIDIGPTIHQIEQHGVIPQSDESIGKQI